MVSSSTCVLRPSCRVLTAALQVNQARCSAGRRRSLALTAAPALVLQVNQAREEGGQVQYQDIDARYRMQLVEQRTTEMANSDLEKYHKVRDSCHMYWIWLLFVRRQAAAKGGLEKYHKARLHAVLVPFAVGTQNRNCLLAATWRSATRRGHCIMYWV